MGRSLGMGGAILGRDTECPIERGHRLPLVKISCLVTLRTDMFVDRVLGILTCPLASVGRRRTFDLLVRCHYYWEVSR
jgi:hypothetical protein